MLKPDQDIFHHVIESLGTPPRNILFFDDNRANVETARQLSIRSLLARSSEEVSRQLIQMGKEANML